jgi:hypothetical protein
MVFSKTGSNARICFPTLRDKPTAWNKKKWQLQVAAACGCIEEPGQLLPQEQ